jgi:HAD superfamily hydrolase (TIGR01509 family)
VPITLPFSALLYDMDGTLVDTEPLWQECERVIMAGYGVTWGPENQAKSLGGSTERVTAYMADLIASSGRERPDPQMLADRFLTLMADLLRSTPPPTQPGVERLLRQVRESGIPTALVSSSSRVLMDAVLAAIGAQWFDVTVSANDVAAHKPDPMPYLSACDQLGVAPDWTLAIEDSPTGTDSATAAGAFVVGVQHMAAIAPHPRRRVVDTLAGVQLQDLAEWFEGP